MDSIKIKNKKIIKRFPFLSHHNKNQRFSEKSKIPLQNITPMNLWFKTQSFNHNIKREKEKKQVWNKLVNLSKEKKQQRMRHDWRFTYLTLNLQLSECRSLVRHWCRNGDWTPTRQSFLWLSLCGVMIATNVWLCVAMWVCWGRSDSLQNVVCWGR